MQRRALVTADAALMRLGRSAKAKPSVIAKLQPRMREALRLKAEIAKAPCDASPDLRLAAGSTLQVRMQEGALTLPGFDDRSPLRFIVARDRPAGGLEFRPVHRLGREMTGRVIPTLFIAPAMACGSATQDPRHASIKGGNLVTVEPLSDVWKRATQSSICFGSPCEGTWLCCIYRGSNGTPVQSRSTAQCVGGSDRYGGCFVCRKATAC